MNGTVVLVGGPADGKRAPRLPVVRYRLPALSPLQFAEEVLYRYERYYAPVQLTDDAVEHKPLPGERQAALAVHESRVWTTQERHEQIKAQIVVVNETAERCGGWLMIEHKRMFLARCRPTALLAFDDALAELRALMRPGYKQARTA